MKLTNDQIYTLGVIGFGKINYAFLPPEDALEVYRLRKAVVKACEELDATRLEIAEDAWTDKELRARCAQYEKDKTGMTEDEYKAVLADVGARAGELLAGIGGEKRAIDVRPIAFDSWCLLVRHNESLAGYDELFEEFINVPR
jgi:hypothetical protein